MFEVGRNDPEASGGLCSPFILNLRNLQLQIIGDDWINSCGPRVILQIQWFFSSSHSG